MKILYGKPIAQKIYKNIKKTKSKIKPGLAIIMIGKNKSSKIYVDLKERAAKDISFFFKKYIFSEKISEVTVLKTIKNLNQDKKINGIIVQIPLPKKFDANKITGAIKPEKDVDGFTLRTKFLSPVHQAVLATLSFYKIKIRQKKTLILANSLVFANPLVKVLKHNGASVEISLKKDLKKIKEADIIIIAIGQPKFLKKEMIKSGVSIIDVGYSRIKKRAVGDVDFESCAQIASVISPVPGGLGPLTVAFLMKNTLAAAKKF